MISNGVKTANQVQFQDENGNPTVPVVGDKGGLLVEIAEGDVGIIKQTTTLHANVVVVGTDEITVGVNKRVNQISIANYSETAKVMVSIDDDTAFTVGPNIAVDLPINKDVATVGLSATEADVNVQYIIKGVE